MYLPVPSQRDCVSAWREASRLVWAERGHEAYNVIVDVQSPNEYSADTQYLHERVDAFLRAHAKPLTTVANTIFPQGLYEKYGPEDFYDAFHERVLKKARKDRRWSGYYFERMTSCTNPDGKTINPLADAVARLADPKVKAKHKFELGIFDPFRDIDNSPYGGQCLSHLTFQVTGGKEPRLLLTAHYRNHYYTEKLLGNLLGLSRLLRFVARESELSAGSITIVSAHAKVDCPNGVKAGDVKDLFAD